MLQSYLNFLAFTASRKQHRCILASKLQIRKITPKTAENYSLTFDFKIWEPVWTGSGYYLNY